MSAYVYTSLIDVWKYIILLKRTNFYVIFIYYIQFFNTIQLSSEIFFTKLYYNIIYNIYNNIKKIKILK